MMFFFSHVPHVLKKEPIQMIFKQSERDYFESILPASISEIHLHREVVPWELVFSGVMGSMIALLTFKRKLTPLYVISNLVANVILYAQTFMWFSNFPPHAGMGLVVVGDEHASIVIESTSINASYAFLVAVILFEFSVILPIMLSNKPEHHDDDDDDAYSKLIERNV